MTPAQAAICAAIRTTPGVMTAPEIAAAVNRPVEDVTADLHALQDTADVRLRNGFYNVTPLHWSKCGVRP